MNIRIWNNDGMTLTGSIKILREIPVPVKIPSHLIHTEKPTMEPGHSRWKTGDHQTGIRHGLTDEPFGVN
jgi:hypothetical protein